MVELRRAHAVTLEMSHVLRQRYQGRLENVCTRLSVMGDLVEGMVRDAVKALEERNEALAQAVILRDDSADDMDLSIEEECIHLIWSQQPVAADLRVIGTALKAITDLERIGDHAVDIAKIAIELAQSVPPPPATDLPRLAEAALKVLDDALMAFAGQSMDLVHQTIQEDDLVDSYYRSACSDLDAATNDDPSHAIHYNRLSIVALYLERIADHAVNIAERVAFLLTGDYRHLAHSHVADSTPNIS
jgi:phosphate transport system protein